MTNSILASTLARHPASQRISSLGLTFVGLVLSLPQFVLTGAFQTEGGALLRAHFIYSSGEIMASAPVAPANTPSYRPLFKRVGQNELKDAHRSDFISELAAIATIAGTSLEEVYACALKNGLPKNGPFWITAELVETVFAAFGYKSTQWK